MSRCCWTTRKAGPPNNHDDKADSDQEVVDKELSLSSQVANVPVLLDKPLPEQLLQVFLSHTRGTFATCEERVLY